MPVAISDELFARLREHFDEEQIVELTTAIAIENFRARFNNALGITPAGFSAGEYCAVPDAVAAQEAERHLGVAGGRRLERRGQPAPAAGQRLARLRPGRRTGRTPPAPSPTAQRGSRPPRAGGRAPGRPPAPGRRPRSGGRCAMLLDVDAVERRARQAQLVGARVDARGRRARRGRPAARRAPARAGERLDHLAGAGHERRAGLKLGGDVGAERHREVCQLGLRRALPRRGRGQAQHGGRVGRAAAEPRRHRDVLLDRDPHRRAVPAEAVAKRGQRRRREVRARGRPGTRPRPRRRWRAPS